VKKLIKSFVPFCLACFLARTAFAQVVADGSGTWTPVAITPTDEVQWPWNISPESERFTDVNNIYHTWVYNTDQPFSEGNTTLPRTEIRVKLPTSQAGVGSDTDYVSGQWQFGAQMMIPSDTSNWCIFQIHTGDEQSNEYGSTAGMLFFEAGDGGSIHWYDGTELAGHLYNKWFQLNVIHDLDATSNTTMTVYLNNTQIYQATTTSNALDYYFKCGDYGQTGFSHEGENNIKDINIWYQAP